MIIYSKYRTRKDMFNDAWRRRRVFKKQRKVITQIYELRGMVGRKLKIWSLGTAQTAPSLARYKANKRLNKRMTSYMDM